VAEGGTGIGEGPKVVEGRMRLCLLMGRIKLINTSLFHDMYRLFKSISVNLRHLFFFLTLLTLTQKKKTKKNIIMTSIDYTSAKFPSGGNGESFDSFRMVPALRIIWLLTTHF
jgi:hypothetical protein